MLTLYRKWNREERESAHRALEWRAVVDSHQPPRFIVLQGGPLGVPPASVVLVLEGDWTLAQCLVRARVGLLKLSGHGVRVHKAAEATPQRRMPIEEVQELVARRVIKVTV